MEKSLPQPIIRPVPVVDLPANSGASQTTGTPVSLPAPAEVQLPGCLILAAPVAGGLVKPQTAPDLVAAVRAFIGSTNTDTTTMAAYGFPVFLGQALEAIARDAGRTLQHTVAATLDLGLPFLYCIPGVTECLEGR